MRTGDVLHHAIAFTPILVTLQTARVVGDRIYILLLIADGEGEEMESVPGAVTYRITVGLVRRRVARPGPVAFPGAHRPITAPARGLWFR